MYILGINLSHHASLCLMKDGETIYYLEDDRWSGEKEANWSLEDEIHSFRDLPKYTHHIDHIIFTSFCRGERYESIEDDDGIVVSDKQLIEKIKKDLNGWNITYDNCHYFVEHHLYHACSAFYGSGFDEAAALIMDGTGAYIRDYIHNRECESMYHFSEVGKVELLNSVYTPANFLYYDPPFKIESNKTLSSTLSCGSLFASTQVATGIYSPGKLMGLSPYGDLSVSEGDEWYSYDENTNHWYSNNKTILNSMRKLLNNPHLSTHDGDTVRNSSLRQKSNLAKRIQQESKEHTIHLIELLLDKVDTKNIVLSGGYFLNCVNNYEYIKKFPEINFYIDPMAHDGGTSYGGVKYVWHHLLNKKEKYPLETLFLGG
jgi:carbamoyltransferase